MLRVFNFYRSKALSGHNDDVIPSVSDPNVCALHCIQGYGNVPVGSCRSFEIDHGSSRCILSAESNDTAGVSLTDDPGFDYYQRQEIDFCAATPCVHGNCTSELDRYNCTCDAGWEGADCNAVPTEITQSPVSVTKSLNRPAVFTCAGRGEPMPSVTWRQDGVVSTLNVTTAPDHTQHTFLSTLFISSVQRVDNGEYTCVAANVLVTDTSQPAALVVLEQPTSRYCEGEMVVTEAVQVNFPRVEGGTFSYSEEHCPSSSANDTVELTRERFTSVRPEVALQASDISADELDKGQDVRLSYILYNNDSLFVQTSPDAVGTTSQNAMGTRIVGSRIAGLQIKNLPEPVIITFTPKEDHLPVEVKELQCVFWDFEAKAGQGAWSPDGCTNQGVDNGRYKCACNHLTNFAALFAINGSVSKSHERALEAITIAGCTVSIIALVLTLLSFIITRDQTHHAVSVHARNQRLVLINLCVALLAILIIFLAGIDQTASPIGCTAVTALLHYFLLAALIWMAVEAVNIYLAAVMVFGHYVSESFIYKAAVTAWGLPLIAMLSTVGPSSVYEYRRSDYCWLAELPLTYAFLLPAGLILMFNMVVFSIVMYKLGRGEKEQRALRGAKDTKADHQLLIRQLRRAFSIMALFGLTWLFGFFVIGGDSDARTVFAYLFCIFNTLQDLLQVFDFHESKGLPGHNDIIISSVSDPNVCALHCIQGYGNVPVGSCRSFEIDNGSSRCILSAESNDTAGVSLTDTPRFDYYQRQEIDFCAAAPCVHGTCTSELDRYSCTCDAGWGGVDCDSDGEGVGVGSTLNNRH
ncbi:ADGRL3 [Branchiostoma lanceolatum]|uniref:ADGRL3 protein n=1 Tax=Branchiostoma lanceolatum TaxID=7740 RepID=A0A8S4MP15_BRALA|nr:ADGRL3 [Branchiostoma lanceolatum]